MPDYAIHITSDADQRRGGIAGGDVSGVRSVDVEVEGMAASDLAVVGDVKKASFVPVFFDHFPAFALFTTC